MDANDLFQLAMHVVEVDRKQVCCRLSNDQRSTDPFLQKIDEQVRIPAALVIQTHFLTWYSESIRITSRNSRLDHQSQKIWSKLTFWLR